MNPYEYFPSHAAMVTALTKPGEEIVAKITPGTAHLWHAATGVCTEAGELLDVAKKVSIYNQQLDIQHFVEELGDLEYYLEQARQAVGVTREEVLEANLIKLGKRYGPGYSDAKAKARADKETGQ